MGLKISQKELKQRIRKNFKCEFMRCFGEWSTVIMQQNPDGTCTPLGCIFDRDWKPEKEQSENAWNGQSDTPEDMQDNPLWHYCLKHSSILAAEITFKGQKVKAIVHVYINTRVKPNLFNLNGVAIVFDEKLRQQICDENK